MHHHLRFLRDSTLPPPTCTLRRSHCRCSGLLLTTTGVVNSLISLPLPSKGSQHRLSNGSPGCRGSSTIPQNMQPRRAEVPWVHRSRPGPPPQHLHPSCQHPARCQIHFVFTRLRIDAADRVSLLPRISRAWAPKKVLCLSLPPLSPRGRSVIPERSSRLHGGAHVLFFQQGLGVCLW
jgi:hypothetical protein